MDARSRTGATSRGVRRARAERIPSRPKEPALKADPNAQLALLDLQSVDSTLDQLKHRLATLPESATLKELTDRRATVESELARLQTETDDLARAQRKADADVEQVRTRRDRDRQRLESGQVGDPRQIQAMQHEIETLDHRISDLEDVEIEVMEKLEAAQEERSVLATEAADLDARIATATEARDSAAGEIETRRAEAMAEREPLATRIPEALMQAYDRLRAQLGGVGVGAIERRRCTGCQLEIGAGDFARMVAAPPDEVLRCEECNRILVRTPESGL